MADQNEIKKLLDDPNVPGDTKKELVRALYASGASEGDIEKYAKANDVALPPGWTTGDTVLAFATGGASVALSATDDAIDSARFGLKGGDADKVLNKAKEQAELGSTQKVLNETGDFSTSDELLDAGAPGLRFFEKFIPLYSQASPLAGHNGKCPDLKGEIYKNYDEVRAIDLRMFREDAHKINDVVGKLESHQNELGRSFSSLAAWEGDAATAANAYNGKYLGVAGGFVQDVKGAPGAITGGATTIQKHVKEFAQQIHDMYSDQCGGQTVEQVQENIRKAQGNIGEGDFSFGDFFSGIPSIIEGHVIGVVLGGPIGGILGGFMGWANHAKDVRKQLIEEAKGKLKTFCQEFDGKKQQFDGYCTGVQAGVKADYDTMFAAMETSIKDKPFGQVGDPPAFSGDQGKDGGGKDKDGGGKDKDGGGGTPPGGGGTPPGGGGTPPGGGGTPPEMPKPENPLDKDGDGKPDVPGDTDGDGKPDDLDGDGKPDSLKGEEEPPETVTIKSGDNEIKVTEPDSRGHVQITVDTPTSEPKTYDLDFSKNPEAAKALMGQNGAEALVGALGGQGATPGAAAGTPVSASATAPAAGATPGSAGGAIPIEAGADGKALIELDGLSISAEVDPLTGEINLSVDNGDGTPEQYGVEFGEDKQEDSGLPKDDGGLKLPGGDFQTAVPTDVTTMPAEGGAVPTEPAYQTMPADAGFAQTEPAFAGEPTGQVGFTEPGFTQPEPALAPQGAAPTVEPGFTQPSAGPSGEPGFAQPVAAVDTSGTTTTAGASIFGGGGGGFDGADSVLGGSSSGSDSAWGNSSSGDHQQGGLADTSASQTGQAGSATLPSMQDGQSQSASAPMGGGMMGGAPMGGGQQGGNSGDSERGASQWRTTGSLFDDDASLSRLQGVLGEDR